MAVRDSSFAMLRTACAPQNDSIYRFFRNLSGILGLHGITFALCHLPFAFWFVFYMSLLCYQPRLW